MMETNHVLNQISNYVLDLLTSSERQQVEKHAATCKQCRQAIQRETRIGNLIRSSVVHISPPNRRRLQQLMPLVPTRFQLRWRLTWQRQLAPACLGLLILLGSWGLWQTNRYSAWTRADSGSTAATATMTDVPTATLAQTEAAGSGASFIKATTVVPIGRETMAMPVPNPTPIAVATQVAAGSQP